MEDLPEVWQTCHTPSRTGEGLPRPSPQGGGIGAHGGGVGADGGASLGPLPQGGRIGATPATVGPIPWPNRKAWPFLTVGMTQPSKKARAVTGPPSPGEDLGRPPAQFWKGCGRPPGKDASELAPVGAFVGGKRKGFGSLTLFSSLLQTLLRELILRRPSPEVCHTPSRTVPEVFRGLPQGCRRTRYGPGLF